MSSEKSRRERKTFFYTNTFQSKTEKAWEGKQEAHSPKSRESEQGELTELARKLSVLLCF